MMSNMKHFSIRSYTKTSHSHYHQYHQLVLPLHGTIDISVGSYSGLVGVGDCVIIQAEQLHRFSANEAARFMVVDCNYLPENILQTPDQKITVDNSLITFTQFIEQQLESELNEKTEQHIFTLFNQLLSQQSGINRIDRRLEPVLSAINDDLSIDLSISQLAQLACLSPTQFKKIFKQCLGQTSQQYIRGLRMNRAKALLSRTDIPIAIIAQQVGYVNPSAFARQFKLLFGQSPKRFRHPLTS